MYKKYTHIFFDLDNTLWDFGSNSRKAMYAAFLHFELNLVCDYHLFFDIYSKHNNMLWKAYRNKNVNKKELTNLRFQNTFDELGLTEINANDMNALYLNEMPKQTDLNDGVLDTLKFLKSKGYGLNIITNGFKEVQHKKIEASGLKPFFDKIFISEEIKSHKPERGIFEYAIKSSNAKKAKSIMVGDDYEVDILGAVQYGIDAIYYKANFIDVQKKMTDPLFMEGAVKIISKINQIRDII